MTILNLTKMAESSPNEYKTLEKKEKSFPTVFSKDLHFRHRLVWERVKDPEKEAL